ncbi:unnamed protein product, partial [Sphacelaria rigidula]
QASLRTLGDKVLGLRAKCRECCLNGGLEQATELEGHVDRLRDALLEHEVLSGTVSMRRACVLSQAISIAAASFCAKLEMMARGTLNVASDMSTGGCASVEDLAKRWTTTGFLLGFEEPPPLSNFSNITPPPPPPVKPASDVGDFELEVGVAGETIQCLVGGRSLARLPRVLWDKEGGGLVHIVPVLFTQGIDIQQSMSHASSSAREKTAFQVSNVFAETG